MDGGQSRMALGANMGFIRDFCRVCKEDTLHKDDACVHCDTDRELKRSDYQPKARAFTISKAGERYER